MYKKTMLEKVIMYVILIVAGVAMLIGITLIEYTFMQNMESIFLFHFIKTLMFSLMFAFLFALKRHIGRVILDRKIKKQNTERDKDL